NAEPFPGASKLLPGSIDLQRCSISPNVARVEFFGSQNATLIDELNRNQAPVYQARINEIATPLLCTQLGDQMATVSTLFQTKLAMILFSLAADDTSMLPQFEEQTPVYAAVEREKLYDFADLYSAPLVPLVQRWLEQLFGRDVDQADRELHNLLPDARTLAIRPTTVFDVALPAVGGTSSGGQEPRPPTVVQLRPNLVELGLGTLAQVSSSFTNQSLSGLVGISDLTIKMRLGALFSSALGNSHEEDHLLFSEMVKNGTRRVATTDMLSSSSSRPTETSSGKTEKHATTPSSSTASTSRPLLTAGALDLQDVQFSIVLKNVEVDARLALGMFANRFEGLDMLQRQDPHCLLQTLLNETDPQSVVPSTTSWNRMRKAKSVLARARTSAVAEITQTEDSTWSVGAELLRLFVTLTPTAVRLEQLSSWAEDPLENALRASLNDLLAAVLEAYDAETVGKIVRGAVASAGVG
ncbi:unnamed protein product, partial [Amoebophrya sp. A120]